MKRGRATEPDQGVRKDPLSQAISPELQPCNSNAIHVVPEQACEPDLPTTFVAHSCGHLKPLHAPCPLCEAPLRCIRCGDEDGPWAPRPHGLVCEVCLEGSAA